MAKFNNIVETPIEGCSKPPSGNRGGPGVYDGEAGLPKRTPSPNAVPEKTYDEIGRAPVQDKA